MTLESFIRGVVGFNAKTDAEKVEILGWFFHSAARKDRFDASDLAECFDVLHVPRPSNIHLTLRRLCERNPARLLKDSKGYRLSANARADMEKRIHVREISVKATALLDGLLGQVQDPAKKAFLLETVACFEHKAYRAAIVMAWNLTFSDVLDRIVGSHLADFNNQRAKAFPKDSEVKRRADFEDYKESRIIEIARGAGILSASSAKILKEKLDKRNTAAHPSLVKVSAVSAEEVIIDLVENIVLRDPL
jgi:hypothetical protein